MMNQWKRKKDYIKTWENTSRRMLQSIYFLIKARLTPIVSTERCKNRLRTQPEKPTWLDGVKSPGTNSQCHFYITCRSSLLFFWLFPNVLCLPNIWVTDVSVAQASVPITAQHQNTANCVGCFRCCYSLNTQEAPLYFTMKTKVSNFKFPCGLRCGCCSKLKDKHKHILINVIHH